MSTTYYELPGIARVPICGTTVPGRVHMVIEPDHDNPDVQGLGPLSVIASMDDCLRLLRAWGEAHCAQAAHRSGGVISVTSTQPDSHPAISEYGDLTTVGDLRRGTAP